MQVTPGIGVLTQEDMYEYIKNKRSGVLTVIDGEQPYSIPMEHYFDGESLFMVTSNRYGGRKLDAIKGNSRASYLIYDSVADNPALLAKDIRCRSVLLEGTMKLSIKEIESKHSGKVPIQLMTLKIDRMSNWQCPQTSGCDWNKPWYVSLAEILK